MDSEPFDRFWKAYPSRYPHPTNKAAARAAWDRAVKRGNDPEAMIAGAAGYATYVRAYNQPPKYVCMASTFLNQDRYADYEAELDAPVTMADVMYKGLDDGE